MRPRYSFLALVALAACANQRFRYGTQWFFTPQEALNAQAFDDASIKAAVPPADMRVGGSIKFILPTRERIKATGITDPAATTPQGIEYLITSSDRSYELMAELVRQRGSFDSVKIERRFDTASSPAAESTTFVVWLEMPQPGLWSWYIRGPSGTKQQVALDTSLQQGVPRSVAWCNTLERIALSLRQASDDQVATFYEKYPVLKGREKCVDRVVKARSPRTWSDLASATQSVCFPADQWVKVFTKVDGHSTFVDPMRIELRQGNQVTFWELMEVFNDECDFLISRTVVDCDKKFWAIISINYLTTGKYEHIADSPPEWQSALPNTQGEAVLNTMCNVRAARLAKPTPAPGRPQAQPVREKPPKVTPSI